MDYRNWHVGMRVECIDGKLLPAFENRYPGDEIWPDEGVVYTLREVGPLAKDYPNTILVRLDEIVNTPQAYEIGHVEFAFLASRFRPVQNRATDISIFTSMLVNPPKELAPVSYEMPNRPFQ